MYQTIQHAKVFALQVLASFTYNFNINTKLNCAYNFLPKLLQYLWYTLLLQVIFSNYSSMKARIIPLWHA